MSRLRHEALILRVCDRSHRHEEVVEVHFMGRPFVFVRVVGTHHEGS
jgi:hypothetical protein